MKISKGTLTLLVLGVPERDGWSRVTEENHGRVHWGTQYRLILMHPLHGNFEYWYISFDGFCPTEDEPDMVDLTPVEPFFQTVVAYRRKQ